jgi:hypothetical protein
MTEAIRSHRRPLAVGAVPKRAVAVASILATLAIGAWIEPHTTDTDAMQRPFIRSGALGSSVDARTFAVSVLGVRGAAVIDQDGTAHASTGVWIIVRVRLTAITSPATVTYAVLRDTDGRTYQATGRIDQPLLGGEPFQPGVPITAEIAFEVPTTVATGLSIQLGGEGGGSVNDVRMDALAQIRLPISATQVRQWKVGTTPAEVAPRKLYG